MELPTHLLNQIEYGNVCLVLGAGCSLTSSNSIPKKIPSTPDFCKIVCKAAGLQYAGESPKDVFQAVRAPSGPLSQTDLKRLFAEHFTDCLPAPEMNDLVGFSWRRIYTFNVDDVLRNTKREGRAQTLRPINAMREGRSEWRNFTQCQVIHLHGYAGEYENGVIFSRDEYARELHKQGGWYESIGEDFSNYTLLVLGSSLDEPILEYHINTFAKTYSDAGHSYVVTPSVPSEIKRLALEHMGFKHIQGDVHDLVRALDKAFPNGLPPDKIKGSIAATKPGTLTAEDIEGLRSFFPADRASITKNESFGLVSKVTLGRKFFDGYGPENFTVAMGIPATLSQDNALEEDVWQLFESGSLGVCILGEAGSGKSTFTYRILTNVVDAKTVPVFFYREAATPLTVSLLALERYLEQEEKEFGIVLIDDLHIYAELLNELYSNNRLRRTRVLTSARKSEWHARIQRVVGQDFKTLEYQRFEKRDIDGLIDKITEHYPSPKFTKLSRDEKFAKFKRSKRQLLVALREATSSEVFDDTIREEFERIHSEDGQLLLAIISWATIARVGVNVGSCQSIYSKLATKTSFHAAKSHLEGIVGPNAKGRLVARHELYAAFIVNELLDVKRLAQTLEAYFEYFAAYEMPVIQRVDRLEAQLFKYSLSNKNIYGLFTRAGDVKAGLRLYDQFSIEFQLDGHFWLQRALYLRRIDNQKEALASLETSVEAYPNNTFARHALAQQRLIVSALSSVYGTQEKTWIKQAVQELREQHEFTSSTPWRATSEDYPIVTLANHHVDAIYQLGRVEEARALASEYFNEIEEFARRSQSSAYLDSTRLRLMRFATLGVWQRPSRRHGQIDFS